MPFLGSLLAVALTSLVVTLSKEGRGPKVTKPCFEVFGGKTQKKRREWKQCLVKVEADVARCSLSSKQHFTHSKFTVPSLLG